MKVLLIYPVDREFMPPSMPPLGLAYITGTLVREGYDVTVIDLNSDRQGGRSRLDEILSKEDFGFIGISSIITQYKKVRDLGKCIKQKAPCTPLVMGGPGPTSIPLMYLKNCSADIICVGEGEETVKDLTDALRKGKSLDSCPGIIYKTKKGEYISTAQREPIKDIDAIGLPAWEKFEGMPEYARNFLFRQNKNRGMSIFTTRGCPGQCNYCMCNFGRKLRMRSAESISAEIQYLVDDYEVEHIHFLDDTFITSQKRTNEICDMFKNRFKDISWSANARVDFVSRGILKQMAQSNCVSLNYGIESGSLEVLKYMKKGFTPEQASRAISWTREAGIALRAYFMIGMPCETKDTIMETVDFCKKNLVGGEFFFATPIPGTELYKYALDKNIIKKEETYLELVGEVRDFLVNMTNMRNEELFDIKEESEAQIREYLIRGNMPVPKSIRNDPRQTAACLPEF